VKGLSKKVKIAFQRPYLEDRKQLFLKLKNAKSIFLNDQLTKEVSISYVIFTHLCNVY